MFKKIFKNFFCGINFKVYLGMFIRSVLKFLLNVLQLIPTRLMCEFISKSGLVEMVFVMLSERGK